MGQEKECRLRRGGRTLEGKALLETDHLLFRGAERWKISFSDLTGVAAAGGVLRLDWGGGRAEFELGAAAEKWAQKILHPPSRLDKLGVKAGVTVRLQGTFDAGFSRELKAAGAKAPGKMADLIFLAASGTADLARIAGLARKLQPAGELPELGFGLGGLITGALQADLSRGQRFILALETGVQPGLLLGTRPSPGRE